MRPRIWRPRNKETEIMSRVDVLCLKTADESSSSSVSLLNVIDKRSDVAYIEQQCNVNTDKCRRVRRNIHGRRIAWHQVGNGTQYVSVWKTRCHVGRALIRSAADSTDNWQQNVLVSPWSLRRFRRQITRLVYLLQLM